MVVVAVLIHPFASVIVTVYVPAVNPPAVTVVCKVGFHEYVYGTVPPAALTVERPLFPPLQVTFTLVKELVMMAGSVITIEAVAIQPFPSVTVTV
jgi:hypothetical protein